MQDSNNLSLESSENFERVRAVSDFNENDALPLVNLK